MRTMEEVNGPSSASVANIVKARLGDDVRKTPLHNPEMTLNELLLMLQRVFDGRLAPNDDVGIKYCDNDGDLVSITKDEDLAFAIQTNDVLRLTLCVNDFNTMPLTSERLCAIRSELCGIRDRVNQLIDVVVDVDVDNNSRLKRDASADQHTNVCSAKQATTFATTKSSVASESMTSEAPIGKPQQQIKSEVHVQESEQRGGEFDPLSQRNTLPPAVGAAKETPAGQQQQQHIQTEQPPSVYGMGHAAELTAYTTEAGGHFRSDSPASQSSRKSAGENYLQQQQQENVATIQPTVHQQFNAGGPTAPQTQPQQGLTNGPAPPFFPAGSNEGAAPPMSTAALFQQQQQQQQRPSPPQPVPTPPPSGGQPLPQLQQLPPPVMKSMMPPPPAQQPMPLQQQLYQPQYQQQPQQPTGVPPPPTQQQQQQQQQQTHQQPPMQQQQQPPPMAPQGFNYPAYGQQQQPPTSVAGHPPPPNSTTGGGQQPMAPSPGYPTMQYGGAGAFATGAPRPPMGGPPGPPPTGMTGTPGANPFARPPSVNPYVRPGMPGMGFGQPAPTQM